MWSTIAIIFNSHKIWSRSITWWRIAICPAKIICDTVIDIMIGINNESWCMLPYFIPTSIIHRGLENLTTFINTNIIRSWLFSLINRLQKLQNFCCWLWFCKFSPCYHNTTWCTYSFHTVVSGWTKIIRGGSSLSSSITLRIWSSSLWIPWLSFSRPL